MPGAMVLQGARAQGWMSTTVRTVNRSIFAAIFSAGLSCGTNGAESERHIEQDWAARRKQMVDSQLRARDIRDERVLRAMLDVPRHLFVPESQRDRAYEDGPLPIGHDQTISQPYIVAFMTQAAAVKPEHRVLEIGTGSGYQAAVLSGLAQEVYTIESIPPLAQQARQTLAELGYRNVEVRAGNGYFGWPELAPFDRILVTAAPDEVPQTLVDQLKMDGLMVIPVGTRTQQLR